MQQQQALLEAIQAILGDPFELRRLACDAQCDPRTLRRELESPNSVRGSVGARIRRILAERSQPVALSHAVAGIGARR